ncbi:MAG: ferritin-like domain-containing protein [Rhodospirillum sp.]|nr:ferritin-like domain-containing protein [Rhodospirillum sp.]MCF8490594.1 ferritin-like domain-containing protein [Rhodospirillum sp.]MCF8498959.1 ferritin-like domain-containing protein [Rhodospirillum sp.]
MQTVHRDAPGATLTEGALAVLTTSDPAEKVALTRAVAAAWAGHPLHLDIGTTSRPPNRPARPARPELLSPSKMPRRSTGPKNLVGLIHALCHIELNAIDLAWDIVARYAHEDPPDAFLRDWMAVAVDEALHFELLAATLGRLGAAYGDLPAHDGLWQAAEKTAPDLLARLAVVPLTHEARGLDTTPATLDRMRRVGTDPELIAILDTIYHDEIRHVAAGARWFSWLCDKRGLDPAHAFAAQLAIHYPGGLKPPFNHDARAEAGFPRDWYEPLALG